VSPDRVAYGVVQAAFGALMLFVAWKSVQAYRAGRASESWVAVPCVILRCDLRVTNPGGESGTDTYAVDLRYEYAVDGRTYAGDTYAAATSFTRRDAEALVGALAPGTRTECFVDPADPSRAVLARGGHRQILFFWAFVLVLFVVVPWLAMAAVDLWDRWRAG